MANIDVQSIWQTLLNNPSLLKSGAIGAIAKQYIGKIAPSEYPDIARQLNALYEENKDSEDATVREAAAAAKQAADMLGKMSDGNSLLGKAALALGGLGKIFG